MIKNFLILHFRVCKLGEDVVAFTLKSPNRVEGHCLILSVESEASEKFLRNICAYASKYDVCCDCKTKILLIHITFSLSLCTEHPLEKLLPVSNFFSWFCAMPVPALALIDSHPIHSSSFSIYQDNFVS